MSRRERQDEFVTIKEFHLSIDEQITINTNANIGGRLQPFMLRNDRQT
jgi:hypothetical protein